MDHALTRQLQPVPGHQPPLVANHVLQQYRDEAQTCEEELDAKGTDAERRPAGFKEVQFSLRESLRRLDDLLVTLTTDERAPFEGPRKDIDDMNRHMIRELFPRQPASDQSNQVAAPTELRTPNLQRATIAQQRLRMEGWRQRRLGPTAKNPTK